MILIVYYKAVSGSPSTNLECQWYLGNVTNIVNVGFVRKIVKVGSVVKQRKQLKVGLQLIQRDEH